MNVAQIRLLQQLLKHEGLDPGPVDGKLGAKTYAAATAALTQRQDLPQQWQTWSNRRQVVLLLQWYARRAGLQVGTLDGLYGPQTEYASGQLAHLQATGSLPPPWRDRQPATANPHGWPRDDMAALQAFYGAPGSSLVMLDLPYPLRLSWQLSQQVRRTQCHHKVRDSLRAVLEAVLAHYGPDGIAELRLDLYGGGFNLRDMRGGTRLSTHAWGIAFDFDPARNKLEWGRDRAAFAAPVYDAWWQCWEQEGWLSLGRHRNFDWMHVQAARL